MAAPIDERPEALDDLAILLRPDHWLVLVGQVKKGFNRDIRCRLLAPEVQDVVIVLGIDASDDMHSPIAALALHHIVGGAVFRQMFLRLIIPPIS